MKLRHIYVVFCVLGLVLPYSQFIPWIIEHHVLNMPLFIQDLFANRISAFFAADVIVSAVLVLSFIYTEGKRFQVRLLWLPVISVLLVGYLLGCRFSFIYGNSASTSLVNESWFSASRPPPEHAS